MATEEYMTELKIPGKGGDDDLPDIRMEDDDIDISAESDVEIEIEDDTPNKTEAENR